MGNVARVVKMKHEKGAWTCYLLVFTRSAFGETSSRAEGIQRVIDRLLADTIEGLLVENA